jgi:GH15 family glucan-1,4-alpha-glucosidase
MPHPFDPSIYADSEPGAPVVLGLLSGGPASFDIRVGNRVVMQIAANGQGRIQLPVYTTSERTALVLTAADQGCAVLDSNTHTLWFWDGSAWVELAAAGP